MTSEKIRITLERAADTMENGVDNIVLRRLLDSGFLEAAMALAEGVTYDRGYAELKPMLAAYRRLTAPREAV